MTLKQLCEKYYYSEVTVLNAFPQVQRSILKKYGILIEKHGRGKKADYVEIIKSEEQQMEELKEFLQTHPAIKEYFEGIEG